MPKISANPRRHHQKPKLPPGLEPINLDAAEIDAGHDQHWVAVRPGCTEQPVRRFGAFTADLYALAGWLEQCGVETVAMESTGSYWIPLFQVLEARGFRVFLVNTKHIKGVPGRKTEMVGCRWTQYLQMMGLLQASLRPQNAICVLRTLLRHRDNLVRQAGSHVQRMQKALIEMNILLHNVISDLTGVTGRRIIQAILGGERDPCILAALRDHRIKNDEATLRTGTLGRLARRAALRPLASTSLGGYHRRRRGRIGPQKAIKLATLVYRMLTTGQPYREIGEQEYEEKSRNKTLRSLRRRARSLGFELIERVTLVPSNLQSVTIQLLEMRQGLIRSCQYPGFLLPCATATMRMESFSTV